VSPPPPLRRRNVSGTSSVMSPSCYRSLLSPRATFLTTVSDILCVPRRPSLLYISFCRERHADEITRICRSDIVVPSRSRVPLAHVGCVTFRVPRRLFSIVHFVLSLTARRRNYTHLPFAIIAVPLLLCRRVHVSRSRSSVAYLFVYQVVLNIYSYISYYCL